MIMTLLGLSAWFPVWFPGTGGWASVRRADTEHHAAHDLLLPVQIQPQQLRKRQDQQPDVEDDARHGRHPRQDVGVPAVAVVMALPLLPEQRDGLALEEDREEKADVVDDVERHRVLQDPAEVVVRSRGEDAQVEQNDGRAHEEARDGVQEHLAEEQMHHLGDIVERDRPDILPLAKLNGYGIELAPGARALLQVPGAYP